MISNGVISWGARTQANSSAPPTQVFTEVRTRSEDPNGYSVDRQSKQRQEAGWIQA